MEPDRLDRLIAAARADGADIVGDKISWFSKTARHNPAGAC